jgi:maleamate amidohydrolase
LGRSRRDPQVARRSTRAWAAGYLWAWKNPRATEKPRTQEGADGYTIVREIAPQPRDLVILKHKPSAFFGTPLSSFLVQLGVDSLLLTGTTTSGCVRATAVDAFSNNYRVAVIEEACFDRSQASHAMSLCDLHEKYADVVQLEDAMRFMSSLPSEMFKLPPG